MSVSTRTRDRAAPLAQEEGADELQRDRILVYQAALAAVDGDRRAVSRDGQDALWDVLKSLRPKLRDIVDAELTRRFPNGMSGAPDGLAVECLAEAELACIEAAPCYDATRGKGVLGYFVDTESAGGKARRAILQTISRATRAIPLTIEQENVVRTAHAIAADLKERGTVPSRDDIVEATVAVFNARARKRFFERRADLQVPQEGTAERVELEREADAFASRWLSQNKFAGPLRELRELMEKSELPASLDPAKLDDAVAASRGGFMHDESPEPLSELARVAVCGLSPADQQDVWTFMFGEGEPVDDGTARPDRAKVAALLEQAQARLASPHAHFAALAPTLGLQFEGPSRASARDALAAAVRAAGGL